MNKNFIKVAFTAAMALAAFQAVPAMAVGFAPPQHDSVRDMKVALLPPIGMLRFCQRHGSQCATDSVGTVQMNSDLLAVLQSVNTRVNGAIRPRRDTPGRDVWSIGGSSGDCEDYALTKRAALMRKGIPAGALRIATTTTRRGEPHAVLVVKTTRGDFVLDNLRAEVRALGSSGYRIRTISTPDPRVWAAG